MSPTTNGILAKMYQKSDLGHTTPVNLDFETLQVFTAIDGQVQLSTVAEKSGVSIPVLWKAIAKLTRLGLIETNPDAAGSTMGKPFADKLHQELLKAVGPMGNVLIQNMAKLTKITWPHIPRNRAREFIYRLMMQIPNDSLKDRFQKTMLKEL